MTACILLLPVYASAQNARFCVDLETRRGYKCGNPESLHVAVTNNCTAQVYVKVCVEGKDGNWDCGSDSSLDPGETNGGFWDCDSTGAYEWDACTGGYSECGFKR